MHISKLALALLIVAALVVVVVGGGLLYVTLSTRNFQRSDLIAEHVAVAGVPVGGLHRTEALQKVQHDWAPTLPQQVTFQYGQQSFNFKPEELGVRPEIDKAIAAALQVGREGSVWEQLSTRLQLLHASVKIPIAISVDEARLRSHLVELAGKINREPQNATVVVTSGDQVQANPGRPGLKMDVEATQKAAQKALRALKVTKLALVVSRKEPAIKSEDLAHLETVLGSYSTSYSAGKVDRTHNLSLAISSINKRVIMPGDTFSLNQAIGPRDESRGFRDAPIFVDGEITPATGGGICQIATTVYNAALLAGLPIVERHHHSRPVHYAPAGRDATVYWGQFDMRFTNNTGSPLLLLASMDGSQVFARLIGKHEAKRRVRVERSNLSTVPFEVKQMLDPTLPVGKRKVDKPGRQGISVSISRVITGADGKEQRESLHTDTYKPETRIVKIGIQPPAGTPAGQKPYYVGADGKPIAPGKPLPPGAKLIKPGKVAPAKPVAKPGAKPVAKPKPKPAGKPTKNHGAPYKPIINVH